MNRESLFRYFFLAVFIFLIFQLLHILTPFYAGILGALVLVLLFFPLHKKISDWIGPHRPSLVAGISTASVVIVIIIPFVFLSYFLLTELQYLSPEIKRFGELLNSWRQGQGMNGQWLFSMEEKLRQYFDVRTETFQALATKSLIQVLSGAVELGKKLPNHAFRLILNLSVMVFTLFFLFRDGQNLFRIFKDLLPMQAKHKEQIVAQLYITVTAVVRGVFLVAIAQGVLAAFGFWVAQVPSPVVLGFATAFSALIPFVGAMVIWLPIGLYFIFQSVTWKGVFVLLWGVLVVSSVDNFLRPLLIGSKARLPVLFLFFGLLGGVKMYGIKGLFLGPLVIALLMAFVRIYKEIYAQESKTGTSQN